MITVQQDATLTGQYVSRTPLRIVLGVFALAAVLAGGVLALDERSCGWQDSCDRTPYTVPGYALAGLGALLGLTAFWVSDRAEVQVSPRR